MLYHLLYAEKEWSNSNILVPLYIVFCPHVRNVIRRNMNAVLILMVVWLCGFVAEKLIAQIFLRVTHKLEVLYFFHGKGIFSVMAQCMGGKCCFYDARAFI